MHAYPSGDRGGLRLAAFLTLMLLPWLGLPVRSDPTPGFGPVVLRARVVDRHGQPVPGVAVLLRADLDGMAADGDGEAQPMAGSASGVAVTDAAGVASLTVTDAAASGRNDWFSGRADIHADLSGTDPTLTRLTSSPCAVQAWLPGGGNIPLILRVFEPPSRWVSGFPIWAAAGARPGPMVVILEGFDPYHLYGPGELMRRIGPVGDALRAAGVSLMVVSFPQSSLAPDAQSPRAAKAIRAAAEAAGERVVVIGISEGGLIARWSLLEAERSGAPLPVHTYISLDVPNRGANMNPGLQAMVLRYGTADDRAAVSSPAARAMMECRAKNVVWRHVGLPGADRAVPVRWDDDPSDCRAFFSRLQALGGYPRRCRRVAVADSPRVGPGGGPQLLHLWLPWTFSWTLAARAQDRAAGSLLPTAYAARFKQRLPLGIAGAYLRSDPTFIPVESALDAGPGETSPFDAWYARPDGSPPVPHDTLAPDVGAFLVHEILQDTGARSLPARTKQ